MATVDLSKFILSANNSGGQRLTPSEQLGLAYKQQNQFAESSTRAYQQAMAQGSAAAIPLAFAMGLERRRANEALGKYNQALTKQAEDRDMMRQQFASNLPEDKQGLFANMSPEMQEKVIPEILKSQFTSKPPKQNIKQLADGTYADFTSGTAVPISMEDGSRAKGPTKKDDSNNLIADIVTRKRIENDLKAGMSNEEISRKYFPTQEQKQENIQKAKYDVQLKKSYAPNRTAIKQFKNEVNGLNKRIDAAIKIIEKGEKDIVNLSTGFTGSALSIVPADTDARKLSNILDQLRAFKGFSALQNMRNNSPTGGALGQVSERENILLQSLSGTLDQATPGQLLEGLKTLRDVQLPETLKDRVEAFNLDYGNRPKLYSDKEKFTNKILGKKSGKIRIKKISQKQ